VFFYQFCCALKTHYMLWRIISNPCNKISIIITMATPMKSLKAKDISWGSKFLSTLVFWNFVCNTTLMSKLLKKDETPNMKNVCGKSWEWMKASIISPIFIVTNWNLEFHVHINVSNNFFKVMLGQNPNNTIYRPIYYANISN